MRRTSQVAQWKDPPNGRKLRKGTCVNNKSFGGGGGGGGGSNGGGLCCMEEGTKRKKYKQPTKYMAFSSVGLRNISEGME